MIQQNNPDGMSLQEAREIFERERAKEDIIFCQEWARRILVEENDAYSMSLGEVLAFFYTIGRVQGIRQERESRRS